MQFQYQQYFDTVVDDSLFNPFYEYGVAVAVELDPALPEFEPCQDIFLFEEPIVPWETIYPDETENKIDLIENLQEYWLHDEATAVAAMPDFFDPYHDDILEKAEPFDIAASATDTTLESWTGLNVRPESYGKTQYNFGRPYSPGKWGRPGDYLFPYAYSTSSVVLVADQIYYVPLYIPYQMHIVEFGVWITTIDTSGEIRLGMYDSQRGQIGKLVYDNILSANSTGYRMTPANLWVTEGLYFLALISNSSTVAVKISDLDDRLLAIPHPDDNNTYKYYIESGVYADGLPEQAGTLTIKNDDTPRIMVKLA